MEQNEQEQSNQLLIEDDVSEAGGEGGVKTVCITSQQKSFLISSRKPV